MKDFRASVHGVSILESDFSRIQVCDTASYHSTQRCPSVASPNSVPSRLQPCNSISDRACAKMW